MNADRFVAAPRAFFIVAAFVAVLLSSLCGGSAAGVAAEDTGYQLGPGDKVRVIVFGHEDLSGEFDVDGNGAVSLPLIQTVQAQGLTAGQLADTIAKRLEPDYLKDPKVSVEVLNYRPIYIYGEVIRPDKYPYVTGMTVHQAIALAGSWSYRARTKDVRLRRTMPDGQTVQMDVPLDTPLQPGDVIEVRERYF
jgi:polysaccharide export outer membrane protein